MTLTLGNDLTGLVSREVTAAESKTRGLGASLTTGNDVFVEVVDAFLGNSLRDGEILLGAISKNTAYGVNILTITDEYLKTIASLLQDSLKIISSAGSFSADKLAVLQKNLNDKKAQVNLLINTASFDGKSLLKGNVMDMEIQVGLNVDDKLKIKVNDISNGKLFRSSITTALNEKIKSGNFPTNYYININEINAAADHNTNLFFAAIAAHYPWGIDGGGSGPRMLRNNGANLLVNLSLTQKTLLDQIALLAKNSLTTANPGITFVNANAVQLAAMLGIGNASGEIATITKDHNRNGGNFSFVNNPTGLMLAQDVFQNALNLVRAEQASVLNQKNNIVEVFDALRAITNVIQKAGDSYLKTDYVLTAQQYSETIRTMVAAITSLQAANKIPEAAQRLIDALASVQ